MSDGWPQCPTTTTVEINTFALHRNGDTEWGIHVLALISRLLVGVSSGYCLLVGMHTVSTECCRIRSN